MQARITISGTVAVGLQVTVSLPAAWCKQFEAKADQSVHGEPLHPYWGDEDNLDRTRVCECVTMGKAQQWVHEAVEEIQAAVGALREPALPMVTVDLETGEVAGLDAYQGGDK